MPASNVRQTIRIMRDSFMDLLIRMADTKGGLGIPVSAGMGFSEIRASLFLEKVMRQRCKQTALILIVFSILLNGCGKSPDSAEGGDGASRSGTSRGRQSSERGLSDNAHPSVGTARPKRVYLVQSYEDDNVCGVPQGEGIIEALKAEYGNDFIIKTHYMNTKTVNSAREAMEADAERVLDEVRLFEPDVVFTVDDNAFREVGLKLVGQSFPVVFSGMNAQPEVYNSQRAFLDADGVPNSNVTGVYEKLHVQASLSVMKGLMPDLKKVVALLDETPTGRAIHIQLRKELENNITGVEMELRHVDTIEGLLKEVEAINNDPSVGAIYNVVLSVKDQAGESVSMKTTFREFLQHSNKPGMALNFAFCKLGLFGGASVDFADMGRMAGEMGIKLMKGHDIASMPIHSPEKYLMTFNNARAKRLGIAIPEEVLSVAVLYTEEPLLR